MSVQPVRRALVSVFDKSGLLELGAALHDAGVEIVSTGSTAQTLRDAGYVVTEVASVTNFPEMLDGRVKTLHPLIHGGILANRDEPSHLHQLEEYGIAPFDLVVVNLYPFQQTVASGASRAEIIEKIDIGGPSMVRGAAKNHAHVAVVVRQEDYAFAAAAVRRGGFTLEERQHLAGLAFAETATYDSAISKWFTESAEVCDTLRYGENPHQSAEIVFAADGLGFAGAEQFGGKAMSYNNYVDADAAVRAVLDHPEPCVAVVKHNNPCGIAICDEDEDIAVAHERAHATDPVSAYGGVIAVNRTVTAQLAKQVKPIFTEVIVAPGYEPEALEILQTKKNLRILQLPLNGRDKQEVRQIWGATLVQQRDLVDAAGDDPANWRQVAGPAVDDQTLKDLAFAWRSVRAAKSNAILLAKAGAAVGVGMGQVNRLDSCRLAVSRANTLGTPDQAGNVPERARGSVAASDAFFPFADGAQILIEAGVKAIVQPGGSIRDEEVIAAAEAAGVSMFFTEVRHFAH